MDEIFSPKTPYFYNDLSYAQKLGYGSLIMTTCNFLDPLPLPNKYNQLSSKCRTHV